jgi:hypothetical protein
VHWAPKKQGPSGAQFIKLSGSELPPLNLMVGRHRLIDRNGAHWSLNPYETTVYATIRQTFSISVLAFSTRQRETSQRTLAARKGATVWVNLAVTPRFGVVQKPAKSSGMISQPTATVFGSSEILRMAEGPVNIPVECFAGENLHIRQNRRNNHLLSGTSLRQVVCRPCAFRIK